ncbi:phosphotransferase [Microbacterium sp. CFH 31415]|uniref:phosphotransferase n=1 Tax=Microbacterium sp. CFH 31415 TaxID=2921732 RepID=UPI001F1327B5|nr:phosphotransferase [Microbacterium sp. CFH 31415]MCH6229530.1 phosphotransferase [Microbacterium sp. CFH 31415]
MDDIERHLSGGNMAPVIRVGDTVRRVTGRWTPAVHRLLGALADADVEGVPRVLGRDAQGREILTYLEGEMLSDATPGVRWAGDVLDAAGRLLRQLHDAGAVLVAQESLVWRSPRREPAEVICHNDFATYNLVARDGGLVGVIDFDFASPGPRLWDLAYLAYRLVPFAEDAVGADGLDTDRRLAQLFDAYGMQFTEAEILDVMAQRLDDLAAFTRDRADETGRADFLEHAAMYERDAAALRLRC